MASRKGSIRDTVSLLIGVPVVVLSLWISGMLQQEFMNSKLGGEAMKQAGVALQVLDYGVIALVVGLFAVMIILARQLPAHPAVIGVSVIFLAIVVYLAAIFSNIWLAIAHTSAFESTVGMFPFAFKIMENFPMVLGVIGLILIFAMYHSGGPSGQRRPIK